MKRLGYGCSIYLIFGLIALSTAAIRGESLASLVDAAKYSGTPAESVDTRVTDSYFQFDIQPNKSSIVISVVFHQAASLAGKERLIIEGRGVEPSGEGITISQIRLLDAAGGEGALYEPAPKNQTGRGGPRKKGKRLPTRDRWAASRTPWTSMKFNQYGFAWHVGNENAYRTLL